MRPQRSFAVATLSAALALVALAPAARADSPYTRTITTAYKVFVDVRTSSGSPIDRLQTMRLGAAVRQASTDWAWLGMLNPAGVPTDTTTAPVETPAVASFIAAHLPGATPVPYSVIGLTAHYTLSNSDPDHVKYFFLPDAGLTWTFFEANSATIHVSGRVVLLVPRGIHFEFPVTVVSDGDPATDGLAIVAGGSGTVEPTLVAMPIGIEFVGGFASSQVPVVLVSDGAVNIDQVNGALFGLYARYTSIYAGGVYLRGPLSAPGAVTTYDHPATAPEDAPGGLIDWMSQQGALPNTSSGVPVAPTSWGGLKARYR